MSNCWLCAVADCCWGVNPYIPFKLCVLAACCSVSISFDLFRRIAFLRLLHLVPVGWVSGRVVSERVGSIPFTSRTHPPSSRSPPPMPRSKQAIWNQARDTTITAMLTMDAASGECFNARDASTCSQLTHICKRLRRLRKRTQS